MGTNQLGEFVVLVICECKQSMVRDPVRLFWVCDGCSKSLSQKDVAEHGGSAVCHYTIIQEEKRVDLEARKKLDGAGVSMSAVMLSGLWSLLRTDSNLLEDLCRKKQRC